MPVAVVTTVIAQLLFIIVTGAAADECKLAASAGALLLKILKLLAIYVAMYYVRIQNILP